MGAAISIPANPTTTTTTTTTTTPVTFPADVYDWDVIVVRKDSSHPYFNVGFPAGYALRPHGLFPDFVSFLCMFKYLVLDVSCHKLCLFSANISMICFWRCMRRYAWKHVFARWTCPSDFPFLLLQVLLSTTLKIPRSFSSEKSNTLSSCKTSHSIIHSTSRHPQTVMVRVSTPMVSLDREPLYVSSWLWTWIVPHSWFLICFRQHKI